jgi:hypothetical protein
MHCLKRHSYQQVVRLSLQCVVAAAQFGILAEWSCAGKQSDLAALRRRSSCRHAAKTFLIR